MADYLTYLGETTFRRSFVRFGILDVDRLSHTHIVGKTGVGKSTLIEGLIRQDLAAGRGLAIIDPHGDLAEAIAGRCAGDPRVVYLNAPDRGQPFGYNPLRRVREDRIPLAASGLLDTFRKLWPDAWGTRMEHILRCSLFTLLERAGSTLPDILRLYTDDDFRRAITRRTRNAIVRKFWSDEFERYQPRYRTEVVAPIQNKLGALLADPALFRMLVQPKVDLHFRTIMDQGGVVIANLSKGQLGEDSSATLGSLLASTIGLAALSRADASPDERRPFYLYVDEFQNFTTLSFANMMSELRKYGLAITLAHQHFHQLDSDVRHAVLANAGTLISFRVGPDDAALLTLEYQPVFGVDDLLNLPNRHFYLRLLIEGAPSRPFSAVAIDRADFGKPPAPLTPPRPMSPDELASYV